MYLLQIPVAVESELHVSAMLVDGLSCTHIGTLLHSLDVCVAIEAYVAQLPADDVCGHIVLLHSAGAHELLDLPLRLGGALALLQAALGFLVPRVGCVRIFDFTMAYHVREVGRRFVLDVSQHPGSFVDNLPVDIMLAPRVFPGYTRFAHGCQILGPYLRYSEHFLCPLFY